MSGELPDSWMWASFGDVARVDSELVDPAGYATLPHIAPNHMESGTGRLLAHTTVAADGVVSANHHFRPGHIIYSKIRPYLAKAVLVDFEGLCSADCYPVATELEARFLHNWLISPMFTRAIAGSQGRTVLPKINQAALAEAPVPVPPLPEQRRIVATLDELRARSRKAREALNEVPALLDKLKRSVLAAAFRGDLTAEWRTAHPDVEPAAVLLDRIRAERRKRWEQANPKKQYLEPEAVDTEGLPSLPDGWCWASLEEVSENHDGRRVPITAASRVPGPFPYYGASGIIDHVEGYIYEGEFLLIAEDGANLLARATPIAFRASDRFWVNNHAHVVQPCPGVNFDYLMFSVEGLDIRFVVTGSAQPKLTQAAMNRLAIPLCPELEQAEVSARLVAAGQAMATTRKHCAEGSAMLNQLDQATLSKAFRGDLVAQNASDEPAAELLERIRKERAASRGEGAEGRGVKRKPPTSAKTETSMLTRKDTTPTHLTAILRERGALPAEALWKASQLGIDDFYDQLKDEERQGWLRDTGAEGVQGSRLVEAVR